MVLNNGTYSATKDTLDKLLDFKNPGTNLTKVRGLLGLAIWLNPFTPGIAEKLEPFQVIMRSKTWDASMYDPKVYDTHLLNLQEFV
jgi:hypothetical protein